MPSLDCGHIADAPAGRVCQHLLAAPDTDHFQWFTGRGRAFDLACDSCARAGCADTLRAACPACFVRVSAVGCWTGIVGEPEVRVRPTALHFRHRTVAVPALAAGEILDIQPVRAFDQDLWITLTRDGRLVRLDLDHRTATPLFHLSADAVSLTQEVSLHLSASAELAAVVETRGLNGCVIELTDGRITMSLARSDYYPEHCPFPLAFAEAGGRTVLIHATDWCRLDMSDPRTGELLTPRTRAALTPGARPEHDLDYFHGRLAVSPTGEFVADDGWVWHPYGVVSAWSVRRWLEANPWESEDGPTRKNLCGRAYFWNGPLNWVGSDRLAVWGYGEDNDWLRPAVRLFDVTSGAETGWFPGPKGDLAFDGVLFASDIQEGTTVWDIESGERLHADPGLRPRRYHPGRKSFLTLGEDGLYTASRLAGRTIDPRWRSADVLGLARAVADGAAADRLPLLADALMDAGCDDAEILAHCREAGPHRRGCWAADLLLGDR
jgi:hypothetical protein